MSDDHNTKEDFYDDIPMESIERRPMEMSDSTFKQRNDPSLIIQRLKLSILNAYIVEEETKDDEGIVTKKNRLKRIPGTDPLMNKQGVEEFISYVERFINSHAVQTYYLNKDDFNQSMLHISQDITAHFTQKRKEWELDISQLDIQIGTIVNQIEIFLRRGIDNKEREGYSESFKETTNRNTNNNDTKPGMISRFTRKIMGGY